MHILDSEQPLDEAGEWLLESHIQGQRILLAALFVDMETPQETILPYQGSGSDQGDPAALAAQLLSQMHQVYFDTEKGLKRESALDTSARIALRAWNAELDLPAAHVRLEKLGYVREPRGELLCTGDSVRACIDNLFWSIPLRKVLLSEKHTVVGVAASEPEKGQLTLMINLATQ